LPLLLLLLLLLFSISTKLQARQSEARTPVWARDLSLLQNAQTDPGAHPASYKKGTGSFPTVEHPGRGVNHPPSSSPEVKERVEQYLSLLGLRTVFWGEIYLYLYYYYYCYYYSVFRLSYRLDNPRLEPRCGQEIYLSSKMPRPTLGPT